MGISDPDGAPEPVAPTVDAGSAGRDQERSGNLRG